jgi:Ca2+-binding EF-hand superfamily protein
MAPGRGDITMDQFVARQTARIMAADTDGDGKVSRAEFVALASTRPGTGGRDPSRMFDAMDTNHDGYLDKDEIRAALEKRFHRMDLNGDGILTPDERMARRSRQNSPEPASLPPTAQP